MGQQARLVTWNVETPLRRAMVFVALTFVIAGTVYLPLLGSSRGVVGIDVPAELTALGVLSPGIAALVLRIRRRGRAGIRTFIAGLAAWRFGRSWWAITLVLPPVFFVVMAAVYNVVGNGFTPEPVHLLVEAGVAAIPIILVTFVLAFGEEVGWRGYLLPLLQARMTALTASLLLGGVWFVWHIPLYLQSGSEAWPIPLRGVGIIAGAVIYTWLFNNTGGSVLAVTLLHAGFNIWGLLLAPIPSVIGDIVAAYVFTAENVVIAVLLVVLFGPATLTNRRGVVRDWDPFSE